MTEDHDLMLERSALLIECAKLRDDIADAIERVNEIDRMVSAVWFGRAPVRIRREAVSA